MRRKITTVSLTLFCLLCYFATVVLCVHGISISGDQGEISIRLIEKNQTKYVVCEAEGTTYYCTPVPAQEDDPVWDTPRPIVGRYVCEDGTKGIYCFFQAINSSGFYMPAFCWNQYAGLVSFRHGNYRDTFLCNGWHISDCFPLEDPLHGQFQLRSAISSLGPSVCGTVTRECCGAILRKSVYDFPRSFPLFHQLIVESNGIFVAY